MSRTTTSTVVMVRPAVFYSNPQTRVDNHFQSENQDSLHSQTLAAQNEFDTMVFRLREHGIDVIVFQDDIEPEKPDALFPNNWFSTHADGSVVLYPMKNKNRQVERRPDLIPTLRQHFDVSNVLDLTNAEQDNIALEGTGALVFDECSKTIFMNRSSRADVNLAQKVADHLGYRLFSFEAKVDSHHIYHTNVMMSVNEKFAIIATETIVDPNERQTIVETLKSNGRDIVHANTDDVKNFACNTYSLRSEQNMLHLSSKRAWETLCTETQNMIRQDCVPVIVDLNTIERAGGSARCLVAGVYLPRRSTPPSITLTRP